LSASTANSSKADIRNRKIVLNTPYLWFRNCRRFDLIVAAVTAVSRNRNDATIIAKALGIGRASGYRVLETTRA
jgi:hypothetical protein